MRHLQTCLRVANQRIRDLEIALETTDPIQIENIMLVTNEVPFKKKPLPMSASSKIRTNTFLSLPKNFIN